MQLHQQAVQMQEDMEWPWVCCSLCAGAQSEAGPPVGAAGHQTGVHMDQGLPAPLGAGGGLLLPAPLPLVLQTTEKASML
jgi:hypothetical protein